ncbi:porin family protein [Sphingomonas jatrophae]|uniref:Tetratricopeptide repeat-containing protein n=1 Tax=Sphingomonas jatrophae TaxID=1166337 RepID=A0A1I6KZA9_9SPHN|nr:porin family protein [Sphingomonas jatrophae]SFR96562.1 Tetratricopeptide repeat-containing protein [Sphingomonas jatrophae]
MRGRGQRAGAVLLALFGTVAAAAPAAEVRQVRTDAAGVVQVAGRLAQAGKVAEALALLDALDPVDARRRDVRFARAVLLIDLGRAAMAEPILARLVTEEPHATRIRLEHGRALAATGDFGAAERELRRALADDPPRAVVASVDVALRGIRAQRRFFGSLGFGLAPDSNINAATGADSVDLFGLPFTLDREARRRSGIGAVVNAEVGWRQPLSPRVAGVVRLNGWGRFYPWADMNVDDVVADVRGGLELALPQGRLTPEVTYLRRWFGGHGYAQGAGVGLRADHRLGKTWFGSVIIDARRLDYDRVRSLDGWVSSARVQADHQLGAATTLSIAGTLSRTDARDKGYASWLGEGDVSLYCDWKGGWTTGISAGGGRLRGDERIDAFADRRRDWRWRAGLSLANRRVSVAGLMPTIRISYDRIDSSIRLYDLERRRVDLLLTRTF